MDIAKKVIISHHQAINEGNTEAYLNTICFPFTFHRYDGHFYRVANIENYKKNIPCHGNSSEIMNQIGPTPS